MGDSQDGGDEGMVFRSHRMEGMKGMAFRSHRMEGMKGWFLEVTGWRG